MRTRVLLFISIFFLFLFSSNILPQWQKLTQRLQDKISTTEANDFIKALVVLNEKVDVEAMDRQFYRENASIERRTYEVITTLKDNAERTQQKLLDFLFQKTNDEIKDYMPLWIVNAVAIDAKASLIYQLVSFGEVQFIDLDAELEYDRPIFSEEDPTAHRTLAQVEPGVKIINAPKLWALGITGSGRIIMGMDTGVDGNHPALNYKWRGTHVPQEQAWFDTYATTTFPADCDGHGTHTMGTMTGLSPAGDTIGVAIGAEWIAARTICTSPHTSNSMAAFQWAMNPDGNPSTINDMPDAINNSWYDPSTVNECSGEWKATFDAVEAVGIAVVFSAGNSGPSTSSITMPKNINTDEVNVFATGAIDGSLYLGGSTTPIASFSSRGPSDCGGTGSLLIKPEACAPGVNVRSSVPGGGYDGTYNGTSMAAPHVAGAITLLRQYAPQMTGKQLKMALYNTAIDLGTAGEDNNYGKGLIDVYAAFMTLGTPDQTPPTTITDLAISEITSNSMKLTWSAPSDTSMGGVTQYKIKYSTTPITDTTSFNNADDLAYSQPPAAPGTEESVIVDGLNFSTTYYFAIRSSDTWANWSAISNVPNQPTLAAPVIEVDPNTMHHNLAANVTYTDSLVVSNTSVNPSTLEFSVELTNNTFPTDALRINLVPLNKGVDTESNADKNINISGGGLSIEGSGGPDIFGYQWIDSDEPDGPAYVWNDISVTGTLASSWTATGTFNAKDEGYAGPINLGFNFKYYGAEYSQIYISSNGFITVSPITVNTYTNAAIPNTAAPNNIISPLWDDLDGSSQGNVYYKQIGNDFVVQFDNWQFYNKVSSLTYQIVISSGGKIMFYYKTMTGTLTSATVGIENAGGTDGLQIAYNAAYIKNLFAVKIASEPDWLNAQTPSGLIYNGNSAAINLEFNTIDIPQGNYSMDVVISSNDPVNPTLTVPVTMTVGDADNQPPNAIADLAATNPTLTSLTLDFTAPADNPSGDASAYDIRYSTDPITDMNDFNNATQFPFAGSPASAGTPESIAVTGLLPATHYYFAIVSSDLSNNMSGLSNIAEGTTKPEPVVPWTMDITVSDAGGVKESGVLTFGQADAATEGIDAALGEAALPPSPGAGTFDARFVIPTADESLIDYRSTDSSHATWQMKFQPGAAGYPMQFEWDSAGLPLAGSFHLSDLSGSLRINIDMKSTSSYTLNDAGITSLYIIYEALPIINMTATATKGWNMLSVPLLCEQMSADSLFPNAESDVFMYNGVYSSVDWLTNGIGYWVKFPDEERIIYAGIALPETLAVNLGWNIIGPFHENVATADITTVPAAIISSEFFGFNGSYFSTTTLQAGKGYWVKTSSAGVLYFNTKNGGSLAKSDNENYATDVLFEIPIIASDGSNNLILYAGVDPSASENIDHALGEADLPPFAPAGFEARFVLSDQNKNNSLYRDYREGDLEFAGDMIHKLKYYLEPESKGLTLSFNLPAGVTMNIRDAFDGSFIDENFGPGEHVFSSHVTTSLSELQITLHYNLSKSRIELLSFTAANQGSDVMLAWRTINSSDNSGFEIERKDARDIWIKVAAVQGKAGNGNESEYSITDRIANIEGKKLYYRLKTINSDGSSFYSDETEIEILPQQYVLEQNYPNPFNPATTIEYALPYDSKVKLEVYNTLAQKVTTLVNEVQSAGYYDVRFDASSADRNLSSGIYFYILTAEPLNKTGDFKTVRKMVLVK